ncbi:hypothetical protein P8610_16115 [Fictibacillus sp. UD]
MECKVGDSWGISGTGETPKSEAPRWLTARPPESEHLKRKSTLPIVLL